MGLITVPYNPLLVRAVVQGNPVFDLADVDDAIMATYNEDRVTVVKGMYGDGGFDINVATDGTITLILKAKSPTNTVLSQLMAAHAQFGVKLINKNTAIESAFCAACMVQTAPGVGGGTSASDRTWVIGAAELNLVHDGHLPASLVI